MKKPFFSIIVPIYCGARFVPNIIACIKNQGLRIQDYELIFIDDASPDDTRKVIEQEIKKNDNLILLAHNVNKCIGGG